VASVASFDVRSGHTRIRGTRTVGESAPELSEDGDRHHILYSLLDGPRRKRCTSPGVAGSLCIMPYYGLYHT